MWFVDGLTNALRMVWEVWLALVFGFALSAIVQAWVPRRRLESLLGGRGAREVALASGLGAASSSCSYAAIAIARALFERGASLVSAMVFQFASTNLVFELGLVLWVIIGWRFTAAEFVGGLVLVVLLWAALRIFVSPEREEELRREVAAREAGGHQHHMASSGEVPLRQRVRSLQAWSDVAHNFRGDWGMLWKEIGGLSDRGLHRDPPRVLPAPSSRMRGRPSESPRTCSSGRSCRVGLRLLIGNVPLPRAVGRRRLVRRRDQFLGDLIVPRCRDLPRGLWRRSRSVLRIWAMVGGAGGRRPPSLTGLAPVPAVGRVRSRTARPWNYTSVLDLARAVRRASRSRRRGVRTRSAA